MNPNFLVGHPNREFPLTFFRSLEIFFEHNPNVLWDFHPGTTQPAGLRGPVVNTVILVYWLMVVVAACVVYCVPTSVRCDRGGEFELGVYSPVLG